MGTGTVQREIWGRFGVRGHLRVTSAMCAVLCTILPTCAHAEATTNAPPPIRVKADKLTYNAATGIGEGSGNVRVVNGDEELRAQYVRFDASNQQVTALCDVEFTRPGGSWAGEQFEYNFETGVGSSDKLSGEASPFFFEARETGRASSGSFVLYDTEITTCTNPLAHAHYHVEARKLVVMPDDYVSAFGTVWRFGRVPVLYMPYWYSDLTTDYGLRLKPGYTSRWGPYLLASYKLPVTDHLDSETHVDYRAERGLAYGQDLEWWALRKDFVGKVEVYYADDEKPVDQDEDESDDISSERYRVRLDQRYRFGARDFASLKANYLSDTDMLEDFFPREHRDGAQPPNYLYYSHRGDIASLSAIGLVRLNDFYDTVQRLPQVSVGLVPQDILDANVYYQADASIARLERVYPSGATELDYSSARVDVDNLLYYPKKYFGFLSLVPRVGFRGTYYEATPGSDTVATTNDTGDVSVSTTYFRDGSEFRSSGQVGLTASLKAFRVFRTRQPLRHVVEPFIDYQYSPTPSVEPEDLYQFDEVDNVDKSHVVGIGLRNTLQTKQGGWPRDIVDLDVFALYRIWREDNENRIRDINFDAEVHPGDWCSVGSRAVVNTETERVTQMDTTVHLHPSSYWSLRLEQVTREDRNKLVSWGLHVNPVPGWSVGTSGRYEMRIGRLEAYGGYVERTLDCLGVRIGAEVIPGYERSDDSPVETEWTAMIGFWLTAFPESRIGGDFGYVGSD